MITFAAAIKVTNNSKSSNDQLQLAATDSVVELLIRYISHSRNVMTMWHNVNYKKYFRLWPI